jgi:hypothetical protein
MRRAVQKFGERTDRQTDVGNLKESQLQQFAGPGGYFQQPESVLSQRGLMWAEMREAVSIFGSSVSAYLGRATANVS